MSKKAGSKTPTTKTAAKRIQSDADRRGHNQDFKRRSTRAAAKHENRDSKKK